MRAGLCGAIVAFNTTYLPQAKQAEHEARATKLMREHAAHEEFSSVRIGAMNPLPFWDEASRADSLPQLLRRVESRFHRDARSAEPRPAQMLANFVDEKSDQFGAWLSVGRSPCSLRYVRLTARPAPKPASRSLQRAHS